MSGNSKAELPDWMLQNRSAAGWPRRSFRSPSMARSGILSRPISKDAHIKLLPWDDREGKETFWHSSAHLMAEAIESIYPGTQFGIGPTVDNGFYYDIDLPQGQQLSEKELERIEKKVIELAR